MPSAYDGWCWGSWFLYLAYTGQKAEALAVVDEHAAELPIVGRPSVTGAWALLFAFTEGLYVLEERARPGAWYPLVVEAQAATGVVVAPYAPGQLLERVAAIAASAAGDHEAAEMHFQAALRQADDLPHWFERSETRRFYAQMLAERGWPGRRERARALRDEAARGFTRLGCPGTPGWRPAGRPAEPGAGWDTGRGRACRVRRPPRLRPAR